MMPPKLYYKVLGQGRPFVMLHGNGEDHTTLLTLANALKKDYKIFLVDTMGHGKSKGDVPHTYDEAAIQFIDFINDHQLDNMIVLGYSDGAIIALKAVIQCPSMFHQLILCGLNISPDGLNQSTIIDMQEAYKQKKDPLLKLMLEGPVFDINELKQIKQPIRLYFGEHDVIQKSHQLYIHQLLSNASLHVCVNETHGSYIMNNDMLNIDILRWLKDTESS